MLVTDDTISNKRFMLLGTLTAMRFVTAVDIKHPEYTEALCRELWLRAWSRVSDRHQL